MENPGPVRRQWLAEGLFLQRNGNFASALLTYRRVVSRDPNGVDAWCNMGSALRESDRREEAFQACERALE